METLYTVKEVAEALKVSEKTIKRMVAKMEIPHTRVRKEIRFREDHISKYLSRREIKSR